MGGSVIPGLGPNGPVNMPGTDGREAVNAAIAAQPNRFGP